MMRAAIYARFSSENQSASSIADQIEVCSRYITKNGWTMVTTYSDAAMSGASRFRPGYQQLLADLDCGLFDVVVVEALDRLGRKLADVADLHDRCTFAGIILVAVNVGEITAMHIGMLGTMAQLYLSDLKQKTWRGQLGRALGGNSPQNSRQGIQIAQLFVSEQTPVLRNRDETPMVASRCGAKRNPNASASTRHFPCRPGGADNGNMTSISRISVLR
jgi:site-specific DNA recombinase